MGLFVLLGVDSSDAGGRSAYDRPSGSLLGKGLAATFSILMIGAVLSPVVQNWRQNPKDGFPLSYYPMFTNKRGESVAISYVVGLDTQGNRSLIRYNYAGTGGLNQVRRQIKRMVRKGRAEELCAPIAARVAKSKKRYVEVVTIQIVTGEYRFADYFTGNKVPLSETIRASCAVERREL